MKSAAMKKRILVLVDAGHSCLTDSRGRLEVGIGRQFGINSRDRSQLDQIRVCLDDLEKSGEIEVERVGNLCYRVARVFSVPSATSVTQLAIVTEPAATQDTNTSTSPFLEPEIPMSANILWEPQNAAIRDLVLLHLHRCGGSISNSRGLVMREICDSIRLIDGHSPVLTRIMKLMADAELIIRDVRGKRTYEVVLTSSLTPNQVAALEALEHSPSMSSLRRPSAEVAPSIAIPRAHIAEEILSSEIAPTEPVQISLTTEQIAVRAAQLQVDCQRALELLRTHVDKRTQLGTFSATAVLKAAAFANPDEIRYYLRQLNLAKGLSRRPGNLWEWYVNTTSEVQCAALVKLLTRGRTFTPRDKLDAALTPREVATNRRYAEGVPSVLGDTQVSPVIVTNTRSAHPATTLPSDVVITEVIHSPEPAVPVPPHYAAALAPSAPAPESEVSRTTKLIKIIAHLEDQLAAEIASHLETRELLKAVMLELKATRVELATQIDPGIADADDVLARYSGLIS